MGKYNKYERKAPQARYRIDPVWTGIGCLMIIIVPVMSWAGAEEFIKLARAQNWAFINGLGGYVRLPDVLYGLPVISIGANFISSVPDFMAVAVFFTVILLVLFGILSMVYAMIYRLIGPPRYTSMDAPATRAKVKKYTR